MIREKQQSSNLDEFDLDPPTSKHEENTTHGS